MPKNKYSKKFYEYDTRICIITQEKNNGTSVWLESYDGCPMGWVSRSRLKDVSLKKLEQIKEKLQYQLNFLNS